MSSISLVIATAPASNIAQVLFVAGAKSSLFFLAAALVTFGMRRRAAAARHLMWMAAIMGAALLPVFGVFVPTWNVPVLTTPSSAAPSLPRTTAYERAIAPSPVSMSPAIAALRPSAPQEVRRLTTHEATGATPRVDGVFVVLLIWGAGVVWLCCLRLCSALFS